MEEHAFQRIEKDLKAETIRNPLFFYGKEQYLIRWAINSLVELYVNKGTKDLDFSKLDAKQVTLDDIVKQCETLPFLSRKRILLIEEFPPLVGEKGKGFPEEEEDQLTDYLLNLPDTCLLIFTGRKADKRRKLYKTINECGACYEFDSLDEAQLKKFIEKRLRKAGKWAKPERIREWILMTGYYDKESGYTLDHLQQDIERVIALSDGEEISRKDLADGVAGNTETYVFHMIDALSAKKKEEAFSLLHNLLYSGESMQKILALVCSQLELMLMVKELKEEGVALQTMQERLGIHEFRIKKAINFATSFTVKQLQRSLLAAYQVDHSMKSGLMDAKLAMELLIASL